MWSGGNNEDGVEGSLFQKAHRAKVSELGQATMNRPSLVGHVAMDAVCGRGSLFPALQAVPSHRGKTNVG